MKRKALLTMIVIVIVSFSGYGVYRGTKIKAPLPEVNLGNIEALAGNENGGVTVESCLGLWDKCRDGKGPWVKVKY